MQGVFVGQFHADLAVVAGPGVVRGVFQILQFVFVDAADVTDHMHHFLAQGVMAVQARGDFHAAQVVEVDGEARDFVVGQAGLEGDALEIRFAPAQAPEAFQVGFVDLHQFLQGSQRSVHVRRLFRGDL